MFVHNFPPFSLHKVQMDIQIMRSDKLGYNAPIEVYDRIYYRYADPNYSITEMPLSIEDCKLIKKAIILLVSKKDKNNEDTIQVLNKVQVVALVVMGSIPIKLPNASIAQW